MNSLFQRARRMFAQRTSSQAGPQHPFDRATGLDTGGFIRNDMLQSGDSRSGSSIPYYATAPSLVQAMLDRWLETPGREGVENYTFIDLGSGKGRAVVIASRLPFRKCIGVEINPELNAIATTNFATWQQSGRALSPLEAICRDAAAFEFPAGPCLVYLFNPFAANVLAPVLDHIAGTCADRPGMLDLLYVNAEFKDLLDRHPAFTPLWHIPLKMSAEDAAIDLLHQVDASGNRPFSAEQQEPCAAWRFTGTSATTHPAHP
jgi:SAM-dependent methyltransferase